MKKKLLVLTWLCILLSGPIIILTKTALLVATKDVIQLINLLQRITALIAFSAIFTQIIIGSYISKLSKIFGSWIHKFHIFQGIVAYAFVLAHPLLFVIFNFKTRGTIDPFYVFTDFCLLCPRPFELYYTFGRIAFWLISLAILAAILRSEVWWRKNWRKFHMLNYFVFFLIAIHAWFSGTDIINTSFVYIYWFGITTVIYTIFRKYILPIIINK
jgi:predicted ferric reductase